jgi:hypothetical protein
LQSTALCNDLLLDLLPTVRVTPISALQSQDSSTHDWPHRSLLLCIPSRWSTFWNTDLHHPVSPTPKILQSATRDVGRGPNHRLLMTQIRKDGRTASDRWQQSASFPSCSYALYILHILETRRSLTTCPPTKHVFLMLYIVPYHQILLQIFIIFQIRHMHFSHLLCLSH